MYYECKSYENFEELRKYEPSLADRLLNEVRECEWMNNHLDVFPDDCEYAKYELTNGWYADCRFDRDYNGAPNPLDYIDMDGFARALVNSWDDSLCREIGEHIVMTSYGF